MATLLDPRGSLRWLRASRHTAEAITAAWRAELVTRGSGRGRQALLEIQGSRMCARYDVLAEAALGPVVEVNRAVAHGRAFDPDAGLAVLEELDADAVGNSPLVPSVRGDLFERAGLHANAAAFTEAAARTRNEGERALLRRRAEENLGRVSKPG